MYVFILLCVLLRELGLNSVEYLKSLEKEHLPLLAEFLDCEQSLFCSKIRGEKEAEHESRASSEAASSARGGRRAKRETAMVSYNDCEARHSGDGVILLVDDELMTHSCQQSLLVICEVNLSRTLLFLK